MIYITEEITGFAFLGTLLRVSHSIIRILRVCPRALAHTIPVWEGWATLLLRQMHPTRMEGWCPAAELFALNCLQLLVHPAISDSRQDKRNNSCVHLTGSSYWLKDDPAGAKSLPPSWASQTSTRPRLKEAVILSFITYPYFNKSKRSFFMPSIKSRNYNQTNPRFGKMGKWHLRGNVA